MNENKNCVHIDYLSFAKKGLTLQEICTELGLRHLQFLESRKGPSADYKTGLSFGGITLYHQGFDKEGVLVSLSGEGCKTFERESSIGWDVLGKVATASDAHVTRLDLAYDDFNGSLDIRELKKLRDEGKYTSHLKINEETRTGKRIENGLTVSFGVKGGDVFIRFYDKAAEQKIHGKHWIRAEIQLRNQHADNAVRSGLPIDILFASAMGKYLTFKEASTTDSNPSRWPLAPFWEPIVSKAQPICLTRPLEARDDKTKNRIDNFINITRRLAEHIGWACIFDILCEIAHSETGDKFCWIKAPDGERFAPFIEGAVAAIHLQRGHSPAQSAVHS